MFLRVKINARDEVEKIRNIFRRIKVKWKFFGVAKVIREVVGSCVGEGIKAGFKLKELTFGLKMG